MGAPTGERRLILFLTRNFVVFDGGIKAETIGKVTGWIKAG